MASPFNPLIGRGQKTASPSTLSRGGASATRQGSPAARGASLKGTTRGRGRGRGARGQQSSRGGHEDTSVRGGREKQTFRGGRGDQASRGRGSQSYRARGAGAASRGAFDSVTTTSATSENATSSVAQSQSTFSSPFGGQPAPKKSPFAALENGAAGKVPASLNLASEQPITNVSPFASIRDSAGEKPSPFAEQSAAKMSHGHSGIGNVAQNNFFASNTTQQTWKNPARQSATVPQVENGFILSSYTDRYEKLKLDRAKERQQAIRDGQMADPDQPTSLHNAITPVGTCTAMCPEFERVERIVQKMVDKSEKYLHPTSKTLQNMETKMLKRFRRSAAGYDAQLPSDIRTPRTLLQTTNYLIRYILGGNEPLGIIHKFVWDRTRSIRNDFSVQQLTQEDDIRVAVLCLERIARFHIMSLHLLSSPANEEPFDRHQEREQLNNTMLSLMYYYDDNRGRVHFRNEPEFRAYYILFSIHDQRPDLESRVQKWPASLLHSPQIQVALDLYAAASNVWEYQGTLDARRPNAIAQGFFSRFFQLVNSRAVSYLMACVAEIYFNQVRQTTIREIWKAHCRSPPSQQHRNEEWTVDQLTKVLYMDDDDQTIKFCEEQDLSFSENANGEMYLDWGNRPVDSVTFQSSTEHAFSETYVEVKRSGRSLVAIVLGMTIAESAAMGMIDTSSLPERMQEMQEAPTEFATSLDEQDEQDELFVTDKYNEAPAPTVVITSPSLNLDSDSATSGTPTFSFNPTAPSFAEPAELAKSNILSANDQPSTLSQPPAQPSNPFASMFGSNNMANKVPEPAAAPPFQFTSMDPSSTSAPPFNPFASKPSSSLSTAPTFKPAENGQNKSATDEVPVSAAAPSPFATTGAFPSPSAANIFASKPSSSPSPFSFPKPTEPSETIRSSANSPNPFAASISSFTPPKPLLPEQNDSPALTNTMVPQQPASVFSATKPVSPHTEGKDSTVSPSVNLSASISTSQFPSSKPEADQPPSITSAKPSTTSANQSPAPPSNLFSTPGLSGLTGFQPKQPMFTSQSAESSSGSIFAQKTLEPQEIRPALFGTPATINDSSISLESVDSIRASIDAKQAASQSVQKDSRSEDEPDLSVSQLAPLDSRGSSQSSASPDLGWQPPNTQNEERAVWQRIIQRAREKETQRKERQSRKRSFEEQPLAESTREEPGSKAAKVSGSTESSPPSKKFSLAESSIKALPTLPVLERVQAILDNKSAVEPDVEYVKKNNRQVDEDEILLNAARIAAEQLRTGPKIFDSYHHYEEPSRYSYSPASSISASTPYAQSASPPPFTRHNYQVAYAPDTPLGLGRTMSRTEQRIRMTGGHGLAYKPLNFKTKKDKASDGENIK
ncbi:hypothetical protein N7462_003800 [Penicillium macrosclerotiorum]|uniref:uncharacterized protein n=1 Tax=Penicillium macrosclerotiorum TaxID=303699 RepID=UPI002548294B|nr:uncharacterized protein N7462_003800 [Penicillium macrosclerotiorum]KAJ5689408.1 hypothetical protein N7462_003800 [Penicillium macrosclerotiorum]